MIVEEQVIINNKVKASRKDLELVEKFIGCPKGYLSEFISWNDIMPIIERIEDMYYKGFSIIVNITASGAYFGINPTNASGDKYDGIREIANTLNINYFVVPPNENLTKIEAVWIALLKFINWYNDTFKA